MNDRITTREAAEVLGVSRWYILALLRAAGCPSTRAGPGYLWRRRDIEALRRALVTAAAEAAAEGGL